jgi:hypothetical protein
MPRGRSEAALCSAAALALCAGAAVYAGLRGPGSAPALASWTGPLPTFLHSVAFAALVLAATRPWPRIAIAALLAWLGVEAGFELMQADAVAHALAPRLPAGVPFLDAHLSGTFDPLDLAAALAGTICVAAWAARSMRTPPGVTP